MKDDGTIISDNPQQYYANKKNNQRMMDLNSSMVKNSDQFANFDLVIKKELNVALHGPAIKPGKSAQEKFEDDLWNNGSIFSYIRYKANQADQRYEGAKGLENYARDGLFVVNTAGQIALFVPGGQGAGSILMGIADFGETAFDINDQGFVNGLRNGGVRFITGKVGGKFIPAQFQGSSIYRVGYEGGVEVITEMSENAATDYLNSL